MLTNSDGTRVAFSVGPRSLATYSPVASMEDRSEDLFTAADEERAFRDAESPSSDAGAVFQYAESSSSVEVEESSVSFSFLFFLPFSQKKLNTTILTNPQSVLQSTPTLNQLHNPHLPTIKAVIHTYQQSILQSTTYSQL